MKRFINIWENSYNNTVLLQTKEGTEEISYDWYFCIKKDDAIKYKKFLTDLYENQKIITKFEDEEAWIRLYVPYNRRGLLIETVKAVMMTYEDDLSLWKRFLVDEDLELELDQKILYFDIENDDLKRGIIPGDEQIVSIAAVNSDNKEFYYSNVDDEKKILKWFIKLLSEHHLLVGWHSEGYDLVVIKRRCDLHHIPFDCKISEWSAKDFGGLSSVRKTGKTRARPETFNHIDLMQKIKELHYRDTELIKKVRSFGLSSVSKVILNKDKVDLKGETIYNLARNKPKLLKKYNLQDCRLVKELDEKLQVTKQKLIEHQICGARVNDYTSYGRIDPFVLRAARQMKMRLPSRPKKAEINEAYSDNISDFAEIDSGNKAIKKKGDYAGGYVFDPEKGLYKDVHAFDFASLYPSIIKTFNVSIDSYRGQNLDSSIQLPTGASFDSNELGVIPKVIQSLLDSRNQIRHTEMKNVKKNSEEYMNLHYRQYAFKVLANSMYGIMGANFSRYYKRELAEGITLTGQHLLKTVHQWIVEKGHHPIAGDTDSLFVIFNNDEDPEQLTKEFDERLQKYLHEKFNAREGHLHLNYEATYKRFINVAKKKYIGIMESGDIKMMGLEAKKRDTLPKAEEWQRELINFLLTTDQTQEFYIDWVKSKIDEVFQMKLQKKDLTFQKRLSKEVDEYGGESSKVDAKINILKTRKLPIPRHVRIAMKLKERNLGNFDKLNLYSAGSYISYILVDENDKENGVILADDFDGKYDPYYYWNASYDPSKRILEAIYKDYDWDSITPQRPRRTRSSAASFNQQTLPF